MAEANDHGSFGAIDCWLPSETFPDGLIPAQGRSTHSTSPASVTSQRRIVLPATEADPET